MFIFIIHQKLYITPSSVIFTFFSLNHESFVDVIELSPPRPYPLPSRWSSPLATCLVAALSVFPPSPLTWSHPATLISHSAHTQSPPIPRSTPRSLSNHLLCAAAPALRWTSWKISNDPSCLWAAASDFRDTTRRLKYGQTQPPPSLSYPLNYCPDLVIFLVLSSTLETCCSWFCTCFSLNSSSAGSHYGFPPPSQCIMHLFWWVEVFLTGMGGEHTHTHISISLPV